MRNLKQFTGLAALAVMGCSSDPESEGPEVVMVGAFSRTGVSAVQTWQPALDLAASDASEGLRLAGADIPRVRFAARVEDTQNNQAMTVEIGALAVEIGAKMIINGTSSDTTVLGKLAYDDDSSNDLEMPVICVACSSPGLHNPTSVNADPAIQGANRNTEQWIFGLAMSSVPQSRVLWNILRDNTPKGTEPGDLNGDGVVKISTIALDDAFGLGFQDGMEGVVLEASPDAIYEKIKHPRDADLDRYDWQGAIEELTDNRTGQDMDHEPDAIIEFTFPQFSLALVKEYQKSGSGDALFLHTHSMREVPVIVQAGDALDRQEGTSYLPSDGEMGQRFDERFRSVAKSPRHSQWDSHVYDGGILFALGVIKASLESKPAADPTEVTGAEVRDAMLTLNDPQGEVIGIGPEDFAKAVEAMAKGDPINYQGASGPCDFDDYGRARNRISHWRVDNEKAVDVAVYDCVAGPECPKLK